MSNKQKKIFIITFIIVGILIVFGFFWFNRGSKNTPETELPWYQQFNPFGTSENIGQPTGPDGGVDLGTGTETSALKSRLFKITDFAVSGVSITTERSLIENSLEPKEIQVPISSNTKEGIAKIQQILNKNVTLAKPLIENGVIDQATTEALKTYQKEKGLPVTGKIDKDTAPTFTETKTISGEAEYEVLPAIRYVERKNGHLYKMLEKDRSSEKISNSTIPRIYEAFFNKEGNTTIYRYLSNENTVNTFLATLGKPTGEYLPVNITDISVSKDQNRFFYLVKSNNSTTGIVRNFETGASQNIFNHQFTEWLSDWDNKGNIYLTTKPSFVAPGNMYLLSQSNKTLKKIIGGINGLTTKISPDGKRVLYSSSENKGPRLMAFIEEGRKFIDLDTYGLADKCVWSLDSINVYCFVPNTIKGKQYPDSWYQGIVSFDDFLVKINTNNGESITYVNSIEEIPVDGYNLSLNKEENTIYFINKKDYTLWGVDVR